MATGESRQISTFPGYGLYVPIAWIPSEILHLLAFLRFRRPALDTRAIMVRVEPLAAGDVDAVGSRAIRRVRMRLIPFLALLYFVAYLDRVNVGFAALQMNAALGFSPTVYGLGAGIFFLGYFLFEVPSNIEPGNASARACGSRAS